MAASKEDIKYGAAQAKVTDDDMLRTGYINGTPLEGGKIADSQPVDLFSHARRVADSQPVGAAPSQQKHEDEGMGEPTGGGRRLGRQT